MQTHQALDDCMMDMAIDSGNGGEGNYKMSKLSHGDFTTLINGSSEEDVRKKNPRLVIRPN